MTGNKSLVMTSINSPNNIMREYAKKCIENNMQFFLIGDTLSPGDFTLDGCSYFSISRQEKLPFRLAKLLPHKHYSRKNIGYLLAMQNNSEVIIETDDDNYPAEAFWEERKANCLSKLITNAGWVNIYKYFTHEFIWPRGFPLEMLNNKMPDITGIHETLNYCPVQQGLVDDNPDVDAIFRLTRKLPLEFDVFNQIALGKNSRCSFNSQNTTWFKEAFPLLYLPSYCSFRMTDTWRSMIAQRICSEYGWNILFHPPTAYQERNEHDLLNDFRDEIPGYINNTELSKKLDSLSLNSDPSYLFDNMICCYEVFFSMHLIDKNEMKLIDFWISDVQKL